MLRFALEAIVEGAPVAGTALVRPCPNDTGRWQVEYVGFKGLKEQGMRLWIPKQLKGSLESVTSNLGKRSPHFPEVDPEVLELDPPSASRGGFWILWPHTPANLRSLGVEDEVFRQRLASLIDGTFRQGLESLLEVEYQEQTFLCNSMPNVSRAIQNKDDQALYALLTLAQQVSKADFTCWGIVQDGFVIVKDHNFGTESEGFEFELPVGEGLAGLAFATLEPQMTRDYLNSGYRYSPVSDIAARENIRSVITIPVQSSTRESGGVLYALRRRAIPFSDAQRALLVRIRKSIEPIPASWPALRRSFIPDGRKSEYRSEYRRILENPTNIGEVESFLEKIIGGSAIAVDGTGHPYTHSNLDKLNDLLRSPVENHRLRDVPIPGSRAEGPHGQIKIWPRVELPLAWWPDLLEYAASLCRVVIDQMEPVQENARRRRTRWIERLREGQAAPEKSEGKRLCLQTNRGEVWAMIWERGPLEILGKTRQEEKKELKRLAEDVGWDELDAPLTFIDDKVWIVLHEGQGLEKSPGTFRDKLLNYFRKDIEPDTTLRLVHGAYYTSFGDLRAALEQTLQTAEDARQKRDEHYILEIHSRSLDTLLDNPRLSTDLNAFADSVLEPLMDHDRETGSKLTETLCHSLTRGSTKDRLGSAAVALGIHANTVRNRVRRAENILGRDLSLQEDKVVLGLAAFIWRRQNQGSERHPTFTAP